VDKTNYITPQGYQALVDEYENLTKVERPQVCKTIAWAASNGDRSENADYIYGKKRLREIDRRTRFLAKRINTAQIVDPLQQKGEIVKFGATVLVEDEQGGQKEYLIVGVDEVDTQRNRISWQSPIGRSLLGKGKGDEVEIQTPKGLVELTILDISYKEIS
jgi:transcription elongation factor GreB